MKEVMRGGLYDIVGRDVEYSLRYDEMIDYIVQEAHEGSGGKLEELRG